MSEKVDFIRPKITNKSFGLYGHVDFINSEGIGGWVIDVQSSEPRVVEVYMNDEKVGEAIANLPRADISSIIGREALCGFYIKWSNINLPKSIRLEDSIDIAVIDKLSGREIVGKHAKGREPKSFEGPSEKKDDINKKAEIDRDEEYRIIKESGLFNEEWYLEQNPDVAKDGWDPIKHYILHGWKEGRNPTPDFDTDFYLKSYAEVSLSGINPFVHYILYGRSQGKIAKKVAGDQDYKMCYFQKLPIAQKKQALEFVPESDVDLSDILKDLPFKLIALYLPQFHPIPENDTWWGKGFTEWFNVTKAVPNFLGHYQPHLPIHVGFYDLRVPEVLSKQVELAKKYGIYGFCFYVYWFNGKRLLERPLDLFISMELDMPFCISWANENWTRRWDGLDKEVLMPQIHTYESDCRFIHDMVRYISHKNYIRIEGKPLIVVQRAHDLADPKRTAEYWKNFCIKEGLGEPILVAAHTFGFYGDPSELGFDAALEFPPLFPAKTLDRIEKEAIILNPNFIGSIHDYKQAMQISIERKKPDYTLIRTILVSWDNTARRQDTPVIFAFSSPYLYKKWLGSMIKQSINSKNPIEKLIFINAWNEWAEGNHLEPDRKYGYGFLQATAEAVIDNLPEGLNVKSPNIVMFKKSERIFYEEIEEKRINKTSDIAVIIHLFYPELWDEFQSYLTNIKQNFNLFVSVPVEVYFDPEIIINSYKNAYVYRNINRGRDVAPFLKIYKSLFKLGYKYGLKFHSKKSPHRKDGDTWRQIALNSIVGSEKIVDKIIRLFEQQENIGLITAKEILVPYSKHKGSNRPHLKSLCERLNIEWNDEDFYFPAGTFFWFRFEALKDLVHLNLDVDDFEYEFHQLDGCLHHALERLFGLIIEKNGYLFGVSDGENVIIQEGIGK